MTTLTDIAAQLVAPFAPDQVEIKPGATTKDKSRALALAYADMRVYFERLDQVAGVEGWQSDYEMTARGVVCRLTICGVAKSAIGDYPIDAGDENPATSAEAQAFKRACAAFGIGRYLYELPRLWTDYDADKKQIVDPAGVVRELYRRCGLPASPQRPAPVQSAQPAEITLTGRITERAVKQNGTTWLRFQIGDEMVIAKGDLAAQWAKRTNGTPVIVMGVRRQDGRLGAYVEATAIQMAAGAEEAELPL